MPGAARLFIALPLPEPALPLFAALQRELSERLPPRRGLRWLGPEKLHLTLKFIGGVAPERVPEFAAVLTREAPLTPPLAARVTAIGGFPRPRRAHVIVALLDEPAQQLRDLASRLDAATASLGVQPERRPFKAHVTLARADPPFDVTPGLEAPVPDTPLALDRLVLFRSTLGRGGSVYSVVETARLGSK